MTTLKVNSDELLLCPQCGFDATHVDVVHMSARPREDGDFNEIRVTSAGQVSTQLGEAGPAGSQVGVGRRHRISLLGECEDGHTFAIVFTQHKGGTFVEVVPAEFPTALERLAAEEKREEK